MEKYIYSIITTALLTGAAISAYANGFALNEQSTSGLGNAFAGGGAVAEDASTIFFNPAGMTYLPDNQVVLAGHAIRSSAKFNNSGSHSSSGKATQGGDGGDAGDWGFVPNIYFSKALNENVRFGIGINAPFALKSDYDEGWVGRYQAQKSEINSININPSIAYKASDKISLGLGFSAMHMDAELANAVDFGTICAAAPLGGCGIGATFQQNDGFARVQGDSWGYGWNAGAIFQIADATRLSLAYRSSVHQKLKGNADFNNVPAAFALSPALTAGFANGSVSAELTTPDSASTSIFHQINHQWDVMADLTWTHWSNFKDLTVTRTSGVQAGRSLSSVPANWDNTIRASLGASYRYNNALKLRTGLAYDQSPVSSEFSTPRTPFTDRTWLSFGANYRFTSTSSVDFGYTHVFVNNAFLNKTTDTSIAALRDTVKGSYDNNVNIFSVQFTHSF
jgi:long-chain fatty acid transport protein